MLKFKKKYKISFLINPISGGGQGKEVADALPDVMSSMGFDDNSWTWQYTKIENQKRQIVSLLSSSEKLIAVGGDGTMSDVIHRMSDKYGKNIELGLVPLGTGNDLARVLNIYDAYVNRGLLYLVRKLITAKAIDFDLWKINDTHTMASYFSVGSDAKAVQDFNSVRKKGKMITSSSLGNKLYYVKYAAKNFFYSLEPGSMVEFQDKKDQWHSKDVSGFSSVIVANVPSFASGQNLFQNTKLDDGLLELVFIRNPYEYAGALATANANLVGDIYKKSFAHSYHAKCVKMKFKNPAPYQIDGEGVYGESEDENIEIKYQQRIRILTLPEKGYN